MNGIVTTPFSVSAPSSLSVLESEEAEVNRRSSVFWECLDRQKNDGAGFIYQSVARAKYDDYLPTTRAFMKSLGSAKLAELWPDLELSAWEAIALLGPRVIKDANETKREIAIRAKTREHLGALSQLGFKVERKEGKTYLYLPDREALLANWEKLRSQKPELPELTIQSTDNTAEHLAFVATYLNFSALLSTGDKFIHDHLFHIIPTLALILSSPSTYKETKARIVQVLKPTYESLMVRKEARSAWIKNCFPKIEATLGAWTDIFASLNNAKDVEIVTKLFNKNFFRDWSTLRWSRYFVRTFGRYDRGYISALSMAHEWLKRPAPSPKRVPNE